jgi:hypothetical protein
MGDGCGWPVMLILPYPHLFLCHIDLCNTFYQHMFYHPVVRYYSSTSQGCALNHDCTCFGGLVTGCQCHFPGYPIIVSVCWFEQIRWLWYCSYAGLLQWLVEGVTWLLQGFRYVAQVICPRCYGFGCMTLFTPGQSVHMIFSTPDTNTIHDSLIMSGPALSHILRRVRIICQRQLVCATGHKLGESCWTCCR